MIFKFSLPGSTSADWDGWSLRCPWCGGRGIEQATLTLEQLMCAWSNKELLKPGRSPDGLPDAHAVTVDCPDCAHPSMVALRTESGLPPSLELIPVRTETDIRLLRDLRSVKAKGRRNGNDRPEHS